MNRKGQASVLLNPIILMVVAFVFLIFLAGFWYGFSLVNDKIGEIGTTTSGVNITKHGEDTFGQVNDALPLLQFLSLAMIFGMVMLTIISGFFGRTHPVFFIVFIFIAAIAVVFSVFISNAYDTIRGEEVFDGILANFTGTNFIFSNLPVWITIITFAGAIFLLSAILKDREQGGGL